MLRAVPAPPRRRLRTAGAAALAILAWCAAPSVAHAHGFADQVNTPPPAGRIACLDPAGSLFQSFTPTQPLLVAVDLDLRPAAGAPGPAVTVNIRRDSPTGAVLGTSIATVSPSGLTHFDFAPLDVTPGGTYVIELAGAGTSASWAVRGDDPYAGGMAFGGCVPLQPPTPQPTADRNFITYAADLTPPTCVVELGANQIRVTVQDPESGIVSILTTIAVNATVTGSNITFNPASTATRVITATRINRTRPMQLQIRVLNLAGVLTTCDTVLTTMRVARSGAATQTFTAIPRVEHNLTIKGLQPGKIRAVVTVNGQIFRLTVNGRHAKTISIARALAHGRMNKVKVKIYGKAGARALVALTD